MKLSRIIIVIALTGMYACAGSSEVKQDTPRQDEKIDREALYWARVDSAKMEFTQADVDFMVGMIGHHAQALIMSRLAPENGASPAVQRLAARIINSQKDEIKTMQQWLRERDQQVPEVHIDGLQLHITGTDNPHSHHRKMAGMLSKGQLEELAAAEGRTFDQLFLKYMIQHHSGAVTMVDTLFSTDGAASEEAAFKLASSINVDQQTEIARMQRMLNELTSASK